MNRRKKGQRLLIFKVSGILAVLLLVASMVGVKTVQGAEGVLDHMERMVTLPETITRPVALTANLMESLFIIGLPPVATVNNYHVRDEARELPRLGQQGNINVEAVYAVEPDLIIAHRRHQGQMIAALEEIAPVFVVDTSQVGDAPLYDTALFLGHLLDRRVEAEEFVSRVKTVAEKLAQEIAARGGLESAIILEDGDALRGAQPGSGYGAILTGLGLKNIVPEEMPGSSRESFVPFDMEVIIAADPDLILIRPATSDVEQNQQRLEMYKNDPMWVHLQAVKNDRIKMLPFQMHPGRATTEEMFRLAAETILSDE